MRYETVYAWNVMQELKDGKTVYCLDRMTHEVKNCCEISVRELFEIFADDNDTRYDFWYEKDGDEE